MTKIAFGILPLIMILVSGCGLISSREPTALAIQREGPNLLVAVCGSIDATQVTMEDRNVEDGRDWISFWEASSININAGEILSTGGGMGADGNTAPLMNPGDGIRITIVGAGPEGGIIAARNQFYVTSQGLSEREWQMPDGSLVTKPCA